MKNLEYVLQISTLAFWMILKRMENDNKLNEIQEFVDTVKENPKDFDEKYKVMASLLDASIPIAGPYSSIIFDDFKFSKHRPRDDSKYAHQLFCHVCGQGRVTLCNDKDGKKICIKCKKRKSEME